MLLCRNKKNQLYQCSLIPIPAENLLPKRSACFALCILTGGEVSENLFAGLTMRPSTGGSDASVEVQQETLELCAISLKRTAAVGMGASRSMVENQKAFLHLLYALFGYSSDLSVSVVLCRAGIDNVERSQFLCDIDGQKLQTFLDS